MTSTLNSTPGRWLVLRGLVALLAGLLPAAALAQAFRPVAGLKVIDQQGRDVGGLVGNDAVFVAAGDAFIVANVTRDGFDAVNNGVLMFESADCSGQPYLQYRSNDLAGIVAGFISPPPSQTLFAPNPEATPRSLVHRSARATHTDCRSTNNDSAVDVIAAVALFDVGPMFTPPFRAVPQTTATASCCGDCDRSGAVSIDELLSGVGAALQGCPAP